MLATLGALLFNLEKCPGEGMSYHLEWSVADRWTQCDGCGREEFSAEEQILTGIESCCGGGCTRCLCSDCVERAAHEGRQLNYERSDAKHAQ